MFWCSGYRCCNACRRRLHMNWFGEGWLKLTECTHGSTLRCSLNCRMIHARCLQASLHARCRQVCLSYGAHGISDGGLWYRARRSLSWLGKTLVEIRGCSESFRWCPSWKRALRVIATSSRNALLIEVIVNGVAILSRARIHIDAWACYHIATSRRLLRCTLLRICPRSLLTIVKESQWAITTKTRSEAASISLPLNLIDRIAYLWIFLTWLAELWITTLLAVLFSCLKYKIATIFSVVSHCGPHYLGLSLFLSISHRILATSHRWFHSGWCFDRFILLLQNLLHYRTSGGGGGGRDRSLLLLNRWILFLLNLLNFRQFLILNFIMQSF